MTQPPYPNYSDGRPLNRLEAESWSRAFQEHVDRNSFDKNSVQSLFPPFLKRGVRGVKRGDSGVSTFAPKFAYKPRLWETADPRWLNERGKLRRHFIKQAVDKGDISLDEVPKIFDVWCHDDEGIVLCKRDDLDALDYIKDDNFNIKLIGVKAAKRGNDVYRWRLNTRLQDLMTVARRHDDELFDINSDDPKTRCVFVTLTWDAKLCGISEAWGKRVSPDYNRWISNIRKKYGKVDVFRTWESFESGYPHVHAVLLFAEKEFSVFKDKSDHFRIRDKREFEQSWHSYVDVEAVESFSKRVSYLVKYLTKAHTLKEPKHVKTLSMMWLYGKRSFGLSGDFANAVNNYRLEYALHNSNRRLPMNVFGERVKSLSKYTFVGIYNWNEVLTARKKDQKAGLWTYELKRVPDQVDKLLKAQLESLI